MPDFEVLSKTKLYEGWADLEEWVVRFDDGTQSQRLVVEAGDAVGVLIHEVDTDRLLLVSQPRIPLARQNDSYPLEIVAGKVDAGETAEDAAKREVREETGVVVQTLKPFGAIYPSPGILSERIDLFYAPVSGSAIHGPQDLDEGEEVENVWMSRSEAMAHLESGRICDAKTVVALLRLDRELI